MTWKKSHISDFGEIADVEVVQPSPGEPARVVLAIEREVYPLSARDAHKLGLLLAEAAKEAGLYGEVSLGSRWRARDTGRPVEVIRVSDDPARTVTFQTVGKKTFERRSTRIFLEQFEYDPGAQTGEKE